MKEQDKNIYYLTDEEINKIDFSFITDEKELINNPLFAIDISKLSTIEITKKGD